MTQRQTNSQRALSVLALAATFAIGACGSASSGAAWVADGAPADGNNSARLRVVNEALYPDTAPTTTGRTSRLERLNQTLYPDQSAPAQTTCRRPC